mgnify:CR=1 FL=1
MSESWEEPHILEEQAHAFAPSPTPIRNQLVPIANKPVLEYAIDDLREAEITEIGVILGKEGRNEIQKFLGTGHNMAWDTYIA